MSFHIYHKYLFFSCVILKICSNYCSANRFEQHSRDLTEIEREKMATKGFYYWSSIPLKVVDFYSIVNGFDNEEQRGFALDLDHSSTLFYDELKSWILSKNLAENEATFEKIAVQLAKHEVGRKELILKH